MRAGKKIISLLLAMMMMVSNTIIGFAEEPAIQEKQQYTITVQSDFGQVLFNDQELTDMQYQADAGTNIKVTITPDNGYFTDSVSLNENQVSLEGNQVSFTVPDQDSILRISYKEEPKIQQEENFQAPTEESEVKAVMISSTAEAENDVNGDSTEIAEDTTKIETTEDIAKSKITEESFMDKVKAIERKSIEAEGNNPDELMSSRAIRRSGGQTISEVIGMDGSVYMKWMRSHENDTYYITTPYNPGWIPNSGMSPDYRNPNGDCQGAYGAADKPGVPGMNCTGFVWHALKTPTEMSGGNASIIPALSGWVTFYTANNIERKYFSSKKEMLASGYLEKGDLIWMFDGGSEETISNSHHIGIYWGNGNSDVIWHSIDGASDGNGMEYDGNIVSHIFGKSSNILYVALKVGGMEQGLIRLRKVSANPDITTGNSCYSLESAQYGIYSNPECTTQVGALTTDANGDSNTVILNAGTYYVKEIKAPTGYALDTKVYPVTVVANQTATVNVQDTPLNDPAAIEIKKVDADTGEEVQGGASLAGAEFTFKYYAGYYTAENLPSQPTRTWVMKTKEIKFPDSSIHYITRIDDSYKVSGDTLYKENNIPTLPLGTLTVEETKAPEGYLLDGAYLKPDGSDEKITGMYVTQIKQEGNLAKLSGGNKYSMSDQVARGDLEIIKLAENEDPEDDTLHGLQGAEFTITSKTNGKQWVIISDKDGIATTASEERPNGTLPFDTYTVEETKVPEGYKAIKPFDVTIKEQGVVLRGIYKEDKLITSAINVMKVDATTGKVIPLAGTKFQLLDENKQPIKMTVHYPNTAVLETYVTDESGQITFPKKLKVGTYYLKEINSPNGYLLNGEELQFEVTEGSDWENPQVVRFGDQPTMGKIRVLKTDKTTDKMIPGGAVFEIQTAEDIITPDGTIRVKAGEVVDTITTGTDGTAVSKALFLGKYIVKETKAPQGYLLNDKEYPVRLKYADQNTAIVYEDVTVKDEPAMGKINVKKVDVTTGKVIPVAATFEIKAAEDIITLDGTIRVKAGEVVDTIKTKKDGTAQSKKLYLGAYTVQEVNAPEGYLISDEVHSVALKYADQNTAVVYESVTAENAPAMGRVRIRKTDTETKEPLKDAIFEITAKEDIVTADGTVRAKAGEVVDTITSGEDGIAESKELFLGTYKITEMKQPGGYLLPKDSWEVTLSYKNQTTPIVIETLGIENQPTVVIIDKKVSGSEERLSGVKFAIWNKQMLEDEVDPGIGVKQVFQTARNGQLRITNLLPGTYCIQEVEGIPGYGMDTEIREFTIEEDGRIGGEDAITITVENARSKIHTTAQDQVTGTRQAIARGNTTIVDTVAYENLKPGKEYTIQGILMNKSTKEELLVDGKKVTAEKIFTPEEKDGIVEIEFTFDSRALKGNAVVVFEALWEDGIKVATHADIEDEGQTIEFPEHEIQTTARDQDSGTNTAKARKETIIIDTVEYKNLIVGQEYTLKGILMDQSNSEALLVDGKTVTAETTFVAEQADGSIEMKFTFDSSALQGKTVVVFENLYQDDILVATHADIEDQGQTVTFQKEVPSKPPTVKTGDSIAAYRLAGILIMASAVIFMIFFKKKQNNEK